MANAGNSKTAKRQKYSNKGNGKNTKQCNDRNVKNDKNNGMTETRKPGKSAKPAVWGRHNDKNDRK